ncbi:LysR family transcriptional regulator [Aureimonas fodinaquatilis]|uniref:LysR family transcriptional regulator n=1 Tax=Aureimonas fodinaquatilis TaxID=2565783 RepID=A0A5B0DWH9_9HYPH|nr:LysR family transcriptional regulator [Aureimonas fodinaquatilis]KAA0969559.1 LysR family transcriptional regulator [Aureimonas fodinaquatilis]
MMNLRQLTAFVGVYEEGSFNKAGRRLNATQSGLSMQIQNLEDSVGISLFDRSVRGVTPTLAGRRLYARAVTILRDLEEARSELKAMAGDIGGHIRVGLMPTFTRGILAPVLADFMRSFPNVEMQVVESYSAVLMEEVAAGHVDFAIVPCSAHREGLRSKYLGIETEMLVASVSQGMPHLSPADFAALGPLKLALPAPGNARRDRFEQFAALHGLKIQTIMDMDAMIATLEFTANSDWMTILPATICLNDLDGQYRTLHPILNPPLRVEYMTIEPAKRALPPAAALFLERLEEEFRKGQELWRQHLGELPGNH